MTMNELRIRACCQATSGMMTNAGAMLVTSQLLTMPMQNQVTTRNSRSSRSRGVIRCAVFACLTMISACATNTSIISLSVPDSRGTRDYYDEDETDWMIERTDDVARVPGLQVRDLMASLGLLDSGVARRIHFGTVEGLLTNGITYRLDCDTSENGLVRCDLDLSVEVHPNPATGSLRWFAYRDSVLSIYLSVSASEHRASETRRPRSSDRYSIHRRLHRYDVDSWRRFWAAQPLPLGEIPLPFADDDALGDYYCLLGLSPGVDEYGWICEYSSVGMPPSQRSSALELVWTRRVDLLRQVLRGPSPEGRLYAAEALTYLQTIVPGAIGTDDSIAIATLRARDDEIIVCEYGGGSFKQHVTRFTELFNESLVATAHSLYDEAMIEYERSRAE